MFLHLAAGAAALPTGSLIAWAQAYPSRPVRIIVGFAAGGTQDLVARLMGQWLSDRLGQPFLVENRPGAGSNLAAEAAAKAAPDGYTLLLAGAPNAINATLYNGHKFNFLRDITPVAGIIRAPLVLVVNPSMPTATVSELIAYAKANPGKITMASSGNGSPSHVAGELFKMMAGVNMIHVPYRGETPALTDLLGGQVQVMFAALPSAIEHVRAGKLRALGVTTTSRVEVLVGVATVAESVPGYEASAWNGLAVPTDTPREIVERLNKEINEGLADSRMKARLADLGGTPLSGSSADFARLFAGETEKWAKVVRFSGARPD
jgi:tripartite-type tricarboxylate transporter receptor subunit TctC